MRAKLVRRYTEKHSKKRSQHAELQPNQRRWHSHDPLTLQYNKHALHHRHNTDRNGVRSTRNPERVRPVGARITSDGRDGRAASGILARRSNGAPTAARPSGPNAISAVNGNRFGKQHATCSKVGHSELQAGKASEPSSARTRWDNLACKSPNPFRSNAWAHDPCIIISAIAEQTHRKNSVKSISPPTAPICAAWWICSKRRLKLRNPCVSKG